MGKRITLSFTVPDLRKQTAATRRARAQKRYIDDAMLQHVSLHVRLGDDTDQDILIPDAVWFGQACNAPAEARVVIAKRLRAYFSREGSVSSQTWPWGGIEPPLT